MLINVRADGVTQQEYLASRYSVIIWVKQGVKHSPDGESSFRDNVNIRSIKVITTTKTLILNEWVTEALLQLKEFHQYM